MPFAQDMPDNTDQLLADAMDPRRTDGVIVKQEPEPTPLSESVDHVMDREIRGVNLDQLHKELAAIQRRGGLSKAPKTAPKRPMPLDEEEVQDVSTGKQRSVKLLCKGDWLVETLVTRIVSRWNLGIPMNSIVKDTNQQLLATCRNTVEDIDIYSILLMALEAESMGVHHRGRELIRKTRTNTEMGLETFRRFMVEWRRGSRLAVITAKCLPYVNDSYVKRLFSQLNTRFRIERREEELEKARRLKSPMLDSRILEHARRMVVEDRVYVVIPMRHIPPELLPQMKKLQPVDLNIKSMPTPVQINPLLSTSEETTEQRRERLAREMDRLNSEKREFVEITIPEPTIGPPQDMTPDIAVSEEEIDFDNMSLDELFGGTDASS